MGVCTGAGCMHVGVCTCAGCVPVGVSTGDGGLRGGVCKGDGGVHFMSVIPHCCGDSGYASDSDQAGQLNPFRASSKEAPYHNAGPGDGENKFSSEVKASVPELSLIHI